MLIPIRCFTCGKTLADKWDWYEEEVKKLELALEGGAPKAKPVRGKAKAEAPPAPAPKPEMEALQYFDKVRSGEILDRLGLTRYCCRRHMLGQVDMMKVI